jgi:hypothetical protein
MLDERNSGWFGKAAAGIAALAFLVGVFLAWRYPVIYWDDAYTRLAFRDHILVGRWLPAMQVLVFLTGKLPAGLLVLRLLLAGIAAGAVLAIYIYTADIFGPGAGLLAAALLATHTLFIALSTVPYREILIVALVFLVLYLLEHAGDPRRRAAAYLLVILLGLTRYDAWLFVPIFVILEACSGLQAAGPAGAFRRGALAAVLMGAGPTAWYLFGTYEVLPHEGAILERITSGEIAAFFTSLLDHAWWRTRIDVLGFGAIGAAAALSRPETRRHPLRVLVLAALQFGLLAIAGIWEPQNLRLTFFPSMMLIPFAAHGMLLASGRLVKAIERRAPVLGPALLPGLKIAAAMGFLGLTAAGVRFAGGAAREPVYLAGYAAARVFDGLAHMGVLVLTDAPVGPYVFASYSNVPPDLLFEAGPTTLDHTLADPGAAGLAAAGISHVVAVYADPRRLSPEETALLARLESGEIPAERLPIEGASIWRLNP